MVEFGKAHAACFHLGLYQQARPRAFGAWAEPLTGNPNSCRSVISYMQEGVMMGLPNSICVGIDVSKMSLDIASNQTISPFATSNDVDGFDVIIAELKQYSIALVLMEATGGLEAAVACSLQAQGFDVAVINPRQARDFARSCYQRCKTGSSATWVEIFMPEDSSPVVSVARTRPGHTFAVSASSDDLHGPRQHHYSSYW